MLCFASVFYWETYGRDTNPFSKLLFYLISLFLATTYVNNICLTFENIINLMDTGLIQNRVQSMIRDEIVRRVLRQQEGLENADQRL